MNHVRVLKVQNPRAEVRTISNATGAWLSVFVPTESSGEAKHDGDKANPEHGGNQEWVGELAEMEWSPHKLICIYDAQGDRSSYSTRII